MNLYSMRLGVNSIISLSTILSRAQYETLNIGDNAISDYGMHAVKTIIMNTKIKHLNLSSNMISAAGIEIISEELSKSECLKSLDLGVLEGSIRKNSLGVEGAKFLASVILQNRILETLKLQDNDFGITGSEIIGTALKQNLSIRHLILSENELKTQGASNILLSAFNLESLDLGKNYITFSIGPLLKEYIERNLSLRRLNLEFNELLSSGMTFIAKGILQTKKL